MDTEHRRRHGALIADPERWLRAVATVGERLRKTDSEAAKWIEQMYREGQAELVDVVVEGWLIEGGHVYRDEP